MKKSYNKKVIPLFKVFMSPTVMAPLKKTLLGGYITQGPRVAEFEGLLAKRLGTPHVLTLNSGTTALFLAMQLAGVGPGDEVITPALTCTATNWPILARGGVPVWADADPATATIDWRGIEARITKKTKAIVVVHWGGYPCDMDEIMKIARRHKLKVIEDCAHAFGASYRGKPIGTIGDFGIFSLQAIKHLTTVDGGLLITKSKADYRRGKLLRWYGIDREARNKNKADFRIENDIPEWGYKFHMNDVNATIGIEQLKFVDGILEKQRANALYFRKKLANTPGVTLLDEQPDRQSSYWLFTIKVAHRDRFMRAMHSAGIVVSQVHRRNDVHSCVSRFQRALPQLDKLSQEIICIPVGWWLTLKDRDHIIKTIKRGW